MHTFLWQTSQVKRLENTSFSWQPLAAQRFLWTRCLRLEGSHADEFEWRFHCTKGEGGGEGEGKQSNVRVSMSVRGGFMCS